MTSITNRALLTLSALGVAFAAASATPAEAKLKCKDIKGRWQICGDVKPGKKYVAGVGIRFSKKKPGLAAKPGPTQQTAPVAPKRTLQR